MNKLANEVHMVGQVVSKPEFEYSNMDGSFMKSFIQVSRLSGIVDTIPIIYPEKYVVPSIMEQGTTVIINGAFRSRNIMVNGKSKLDLYLYSDDINLADPKATSMNEIKLIGYLCKVPVYRTTPLGRDICDALIAVPRRLHKSDYIPIITWSRNARYLCILNVGTKIMINGRIQSRIYYKDNKEHVAYEISASTIDEVHDD